MRHAARRAEWERARPLAAVLALGVLPLSPAAAQTLHERVLTGAMRCENGVCRGVSDREAFPKAVVDQGKLVYAPTDDASPKAGEPIYTPRPERAVEVGGAEASQPAGDVPP